MKEFKFCVCDDDKNFLEIINEKINETLKDISEFEVVTVEDGETLVSMCKSELPDAVFLDIDMPNLNGFETAKELRSLKEDICIIFVTSQEDRVYESWTYQPFWFVRKSYLDDLVSILPRLVKKLRAERSLGKSVRIKFENRMLEIDLDTLLTVEADGHYVVFNYCTNEPVKLRCKISDAEQLLSSLGVVRISKGILVNLRAVSKMTGKKIILTNKNEYNIGRDRVEEVRQRFLEYMRGGDI